MFAVAFGGAMIAQLLPALVLQGQVSGASWGWSTPPSCALAAGASCSEGFVLAGQTCTVVCAAGTPSSATVNCPASAGAYSPDNGWWYLCGSGSGACSNNMMLSSGCVVTTTTTTTTTTVPAADNATTTPPTTTVPAAANATTTATTTTAGATAIANGAPRAAGASVLAVAAVVLKASVA